MRHAVSTLAGIMMALALAGGLAAPAAAQVPLVSPDFGSPPEPSTLTVHTLAVALPTTAVLARAGARAVERAASARLRAFGRREATEEARAQAALAEAAAPIPVGPDPLNIAAAAAAPVSEIAETILSGLPRVLQTPGARAIATDRAIAEAGLADLARLDGLAGRDFEAAYVAIAADGLRRLEATYRDYVQNGDEMALRGLAVHELARVRARLAALERR